MLVVTEKQPRTQNKIHEKRMTRWEVLYACRFAMKTAALCSMLLWVHMGDHESKRGSKPRNKLETKTETPKMERNYYKKACGETDRGMTI